MFSKDQQEQNAALLDMDIQQEEVLAFFRDYWQPILGIAIALVIMTGGIQVCRSWNARVAGEQTSQMLPLVAAAPSEQNAKALEDFAASKATGGRRDIALLFAAANYESANKPVQAQRILKIITDSSAPEDIRDYARLLLVNSGGDVKLLDKIGKNSAWAPAAAEVHALAEPNMQKQRDAYAAIAAGPKSPPSLHARAAEFSGQSGAE